jgi:hypothetical protein
MTLAALKAGKPTLAPVATPPATDSAGHRAPAKAPDPRRGQTLRLNVAAWKALKRLALDEEKTSHDLLIEAVNLLFKSKKMPPIA